MSTNINRRRFIQASAVIGGAGLSTLAGCLGDDSSGPESLLLVGFPEEGALVLSDYYNDFEGEADIIVPDGLQDPTLPDAVGRSLEGITGTAPAAGGPQADAYADLYEDAYDTAPGIFTPHTFDAAAVLILANAAAGENTGEAVRDQVRRVANPGGETVGPENFEEGLQLAAEGSEIEYQGASTAVSFDENGDVATAVYDVWEYIDDDENPIQVNDTLEFDVSEPGGQMADSSPGGLGREIMLGILLPETGNLAPVGGPMVDAGLLAVDLANEADVDVTVDVQVEDTQTDTDAAQSGAQALSDAGYPSFVGAAASDSSIPLAESFVGPNQIVGISPSSTAPAITNIDSDGYFFRTAPSDLLQGPAIAEVVYEEQGNETASTLYRDDDYGLELQEQFASTFEDLGGEIYHQVSFDPDDSSFFAPLDEALSPP